MNAKAAPIQVSFATPAAASSVLVQRKCACGAAPKMERECDQCQKSRLTVQRRSLQHAPAAPRTNGFAGGDAVLVQTQMTVNNPDDEYEREAEHVAEKVVDKDEALDIHNLPQLAVQAAGRPASAPALRPDVEAGIQSARGSGDPLPASSRGFFESRMHHEFGGVRVHTDRRAGDMAESIQAQAFTTGADIFFAPGEYAPNTRAGRKLLAHELTHVVQQVPHVARQEKETPGPKCTTLFRDGEGTPVAPFSSPIGTVNYFIWGTWREGDSIDAFGLRTLRLWIPWRFGHLPAGVRDQITTYVLSRAREPISDVTGKVGCQYTIHVTQVVMAHLRKLTGEAEYEQFSKDATKKGKRESRDVKQLHALYSFLMKAFPQHDIFSKYAASL